MASTRRIASAFAAVCLLVVPPAASSQDGNPWASIKQSERTYHTAAGQTPKDGDGTAEAQVRALEAQLVKAALKGDASSLEKYFANDFVAIRGDGKLGTKSEEIENLRSGTTKFESYDVHELKVRIYGDAAITNLLYSAKATINGKPYSGEVRATRVWVKQKDNWKLVTHQATRVASTSPCRLGETMSIRVAPPLMPRFWLCRGATGRV